MNGAAETALALRIEGLKKTYRSPDGEITPVIDVPAFALAKTEQIALRGVSGSGKTTFLNIIAGILTADEGRVWVESAPGEGARFVLAFPRQAVVAEPPAA